MKVYDIICWILVRQKRLADVSLLAIGITVYRRTCSILWYKHDAIWVYRKRHAASVLLGAMDCNIVRHVRWYWHRIWAEAYKRSDCFVVQPETTEEEWRDVHSCSTYCNRAFHFGKGMPAVNQVIAVRSSESTCLTRAFENSMKYWSYSDAYRVHWGQCHTLNRCASHHERLERRKRRCSFMTIMTFGSDLSAISADHSPISEVSGEEFTKGRNDSVSLLGQGVQRRSILGIEDHRSRLTIHNGDM